MATITNRVVWADNTTDLKAKILDTTDKVVAMKDAVDKTARSLGGEGLFIAANRTTAAVQALGGELGLLGGAAKLTASQQESINAQLTRAIEKYDAMGMSAPADMLALEEATRDTNHETEGLGARITGLVMAWNTAKDALRGVVDTAADWVHASNEQQDASVRLDAALRAQGTYTPQLSAQYADLATQFQKTTVHGDELIQEMAAMLVQIGNVAPKDMKAALTAATDLSAGLRIDLQTATMLVGKAFAGETGTLKRYGIVIDETKLKTEGAQAVLAAIAEKMGGQAAAQAQTFSGEMARLGNVIGEVKESLGDFIGNSIKPLIDWFMQLPAPARDGAITIGLVGGAMGTAALAIGSVVGALKLALPMLGIQGGLTGLASMAGPALAIAGQAAIVFGAAVLAWKFGRVIADVFDLDNKISGLLVRIGAFGDSKAAAADARINTIAVASQHAGRTITDYSEAIRINQEWAEKQIATNERLHPGIDAQAAAYAKLKGEAASLKESALTPLTAQQRDLAIAFDKGGVSVADITKKLNAVPGATKVSEEAVKLLVDAQKKSAAAAAEQAKALDDARKAAIPLTEAQKATAIANDNVGRSAEYTAATLHVSAAAVKTYLESVKNGTEIAQLWVKAEETMLDASVKFIRKAVDESQAAAQKEADASARSLVRRLNDATDYEEKNRQLTMHGTELTVHQLDVERTAKIAALDAESSDRGAVYQRDRAAIDAFYNHQRDVATGASDTIVERMRSAGVATREDMADTALRARDDYNQMAAHSELWSKAAIQHQKRVAEEAEAAARGTKTSWDRTYDAFSRVSDIMSFIPGKIGAIGQIAAQAGEAITKNLADGNVWGAVIAGASAVVNIFGKLFGSAGRDAVKEFAATFKGGFDGPGGMHQALLASGAAGEAMWQKLSNVGRNDAATAKTLIAEATKLIEDQKAKTDALRQSQNQQLGDLLQQLQGIGAGTMLQPYLDRLANAKDLTADNVELLKSLAGDGEADWKKIQEAVQRYGGDVSKLGGTFQAQRLHDGWQQITDDMALFERGGISAGDAIALTKDKINELVQQSQQFGVDIPENMRPFIENLIATGGLLDANGTKITDINKLKFGESLQDSVKALVDKIGELIDKLSAVPDAMNKIPSRKVVDVEFNGRHTGSWPDGEGDDAATAATGGYVGKHNIVAFPFSGGGPVFRPIGTDTVPAMLTPGEIVLNAAQQRNVAGAVSGGGAQTIDYDRLANAIAAALQRAPLVADVNIDQSALEGRTRRVVKRMANDGSLTIGSRQVLARVS